MNVTTTLRLGRSLGWPGLFVGLLIFVLVLLMLAHSGHALVAPPKLPMSSLIPAT